MSAFGTPGAIQIGNTLEVFFSPEARTLTEKKARAALNRGVVVKWQDKRRQWITHFVVYDTAKEGSECFTWSPNGERVLNERILVTVTQDGTRTEEHLGTCWRDYE